MAGCGLSSWHSALLISPMLSSRELGRYDGVLKKAASECVGKAGGQPFFLARDIVKRHVIIAVIIARAQAQPVAQRNGQRQFRRHPHIIFRRVDIGLQIGNEIKLIVARQKPAHLQRRGEAGDFAVKRVIGQMLSLSRISPTMASTRRSPSSLLKNRLTTPPNRLRSAILAKSSCSVWIKVSTRNGLPVSART